MGPYSFGLRVLLFALAVAASLVLADYVVPRETLTLFFEPTSDYVERDSRIADRIVFLGDSVIGTAYVKDMDHRSISAILADLTGVDVLDWSHAGHAQKQLSFRLKAILRSQYVPQAVVIPVNLRGFSPCWEKNPHWQFPEFETTELDERTMSTRAFDVLQGKEDLAEEYREYSTTPIRVDEEVIGILNSPDKGQEMPVSLTEDGKWIPCENGPVSEVIRVRLVSRYGFPLRDSQTLPFLVENLSLASQASFPVVFYLTPIDREFIAQYLDDREVRLVEQNLEALRNLMSESGVPWADLSTACTKEEFDHPDDQPNEHLKFSGRQRVAREVACLLKLAETRASR